MYDLRCDPVVLATVCPISMATGSLSPMYTVATPLTTRFNHCMTFY